MLKSMTGFGRGEHSVNGIEYTVEIKSVNHRYLDFNIRLPRQYALLEDTIRKVISKSISRGKIDVNVVINDFGDKSKKLVFNEDLLMSYIKAADDAEKIYGVKNNFAFSNVMSISDIIKIENESNEEQLVADFSVALNNAINANVCMRTTEGSSLYTDLSDKLSKMENLFRTIEEKSQTVVDEYREKLMARINEVKNNIEIEIDDTRLNGEIAVFADRSCIDEEITRFKSHICQFRDTMNFNEPIGKKLDFIVQEMNREVNTIGSKANNLDITKTVIELKNMIEMVREQIQNIE